MDEKTTLTMVNEKLKGSIMGTESLANFVNAFFDGFEELKDGFQMGDAVSLLGSLMNAYLSKDLALAEALDLQNDEIEVLLSIADDYNLADSATEATQILKWILVSIQTYDILIHEKNK